MKKFLIFLVLLPSVCWGQYWGERATEQSFESSALHFQSHFLNPYGLHRFRDVAPYLVDDPFLNLYLNPANLPRISDGHTLFYLDFRGDRTEPQIIQHYYGVPYYDLGWRPDPRWFSVARQEAEPIFSLGLLTYPFREEIKNLFVGGTYQIIYAEDPFYTLPAWIYNPRYGYDAFGERNSPTDEIIPVQERYYGEDELSTEAHLVSAYAGYPVADRVDLGLGINTVWHYRDGSYINLQSDEYGTTNDWDYRTYQERSRDQDYHHFDVNGGISSTLTEGLTAGLKLGYLSGEADQDYLTADSSRYARGDSLLDPSWYVGMYQSSTGQDWNRDGDAWYVRLMGTVDLKENRKMSAWFRYQKTDIDLTNSSCILDTSLHISEYWSSYYRRTRRYHSESYAKDIRSGTGDSERRIKEGCLVFKWGITPEFDVSVAPLYRQNNSDVHSSEIATVDRWSMYHSAWIDSVQYSHDRRLYEAKRLVWKHSSKYQTIQIPVLLRWHAHEHFRLLLGVNRILERWKISDQTTAYFDKRERTEDGEVRTETDFAERYTMPDEKITEDYTAVLSSFEVIVSPQFQIRLLLEPETEEEFKINQWWLSFQLEM